jgi:hypothetical protein
MEILNLTQHPATREQREAGVIDLKDEARKELSDLLTFDEIPDHTELKDRAYAIASTLAAGYSYCMIGGAPFFMRYMEDALIQQGRKPLYAFSRRESVERKDYSGKVIKTAVFRHLGFVPA